jgi:transposase
MLLRELLKQGLSKSSLAIRFGISRDTLHRWVRDGQLDRDHDGEPVRARPRPAVPGKLDGYKALIRERLKDFPALSAVRLYEEVKEAGYAGSYNQVKTFAKQVRPRPPAEPVIRFETEPGHQGQVDFAECRFPWGDVTPCW